MGKRRPSLSNITSKVQKMSLKVERPIAKVSAKNAQRNLIFEQLLKEHDNTISHTTQSSSKPLRPLKSSKKRRQTHADKLANNLSKLLS